MADVLTATVQDTRGAIATALFTIPIINPIAMPSLTMPGATQGVAYSAPITVTGATGGVSPSVIGVSSANSYSMSGLNIVGTPSIVGTDIVTVLLFDALGIPQSQQYSITVAPSGGGGGTLSLLFPQSVPGGVGIQMQFTMQAYGPSLTLPINWLTASVGSIDSAGNWTFTPVGAGSQVVTITFSDSGGHTGSGSFTCVIT